VAAIADDLKTRTRTARRVLARLDRAAKDAALEEIAVALHARRAAIIAANADDLAAGREVGLSRALLDRLMLDEGRIAALCQAVRDVAALDDPCGEVIERFTRPNGLDITKLRVPLGRVLVVYEARPNVTVDVAALCIKSGNVAILRGSSSARATNAVLLEAVHAGLASAGLPADAAVDLTCSRDELARFVADPGNAEVVIPRGGEALKDFLIEHARIPVLAAAGGNCHVYVDADCDAEMAERIVLNAKVQRPGVCNAAETILVHKALIATVLPRLLRALAEAGVEIRGCDRTAAAAGGVPVTEASDDDYAREFGDLIVAVRVVDSLDDALAHIDRFSTGHSEAIVTADPANGERFAAGVDSACVYVNASTRFTDGGEFGFGAEIGNSTARLHARGPVGLRDLTTSRYVVRGTGQIRA
jgi:glutamate-5-semialdehyde dehydrogenase